MFISWIKKYGVILLLGTIIIWGITEMVARKQQERIATQLETSRSEAKSQYDIDKALWQARFAIQDSNYAKLSRKLAQQKINYQPIVQRDRIIEKEYHNNPTIENCNEVIWSKNDRIVSLENQVDTQDSVILNRNRSILERDRALAKSDSTVQKLNGVATGAINALNRANKKANRRLTLAAGPGVVVGTDLKPRMGGALIFGFRIW